MTNSLILVGGGGHCKACIDVAEAEGWKIQGIVDPIQQDRLLGYPILGGDDQLSRLVNQEVQFLISIGQIKSAAIRKSVFLKLKSLGAIMAKVVSVDARLSSHSTIGEGTILLHGAVVNAGSQVGSNCIINTMSLVEHDCVIGDHVHISTGALVNGGCQIGDEVFIGSGAIIANGIQIASNTVVGAGSVVINNIIEPGTYAGNPARRIQS